MKTETQKIHVPSDFFTKTLKEYQDWQFAWFRETLQNAVDAGATKVDFSINKVDDRIQLSVKDNGSGINIETLKKGLLTLGGSIKNQEIDKSKIIGGYGYAKHIILFAHYHYKIHTQKLVVTGQGIHYQIKHKQEFLKGTEITVLLQNKTSIKQLKTCCILLIRHFTSNIKITLNQKTIRVSSVSHDFEINTVLGLLQFSEIEEYSDIELWIRMKGLPMFRYYIEDSGQRGLIASLDLTGKPTELLTTNRDGLTHKASEMLDRLLHELIHQRQQFKMQNALNLVFNPDTEIINPLFNQTQLLSACKQSQQKALHYPSVLQRKLHQIISELSQLPLIESYPENFHLHVTNMLLHNRRSSPTQITFSQIKYTLNLQRTRLLGWCWHYAVQWILETYFLQSCFDIEFDEKNSSYMSLANPKQPLSIQIGFVFDESCEGINFLQNNTMKILLNPEFFQADWLIGDVIDLAIHECAHALEPSHGELFSDAELNIRRDFRRLIDEQEILVDAQNIIDELSLIYQDN